MKISMRKNLFIKFFERAMELKKVNNLFAAVSDHQRKVGLSSLVCSQGDCRKEPRRDPLCTKTKINQNS